jgi:putative oxidoreductase
MTAWAATYSATAKPLNALGGYLGLLGLRLLLAWEFGEAGIEKLTGTNWFAEIQDRFPFPFNVIPADISWQLVTWTEIGGAMALVLGLGTRVFGLALMILTVVAWASVHAGLGYNVCQNGFQLPLMYLVMLLPLVLTGPGKASVDHLLAQRRR